MKNLDPKSVWLFFVSSLVHVVWLSFVLSFIALSFVADEEGYFDLGAAIGWYVAAIGVFALVSYGWSLLTYRFFKYELTELGFRKESGVIYKKYVTIPYTRIQNVDINRGILARLLGLSDLMIQTAGASASFSRYGMAGAGAEGRLPGVSKADAEVLRDELIRRASEASRSQGL
jgi:uncharacterized membrane protein YdbT with pleckstrin-like domain